jgi:hypothetical protein
LNEKRPKTSDDDVRLTIAKSATYHRFVIDNQENEKTMSRHKLLLLLIITFGCNNKKSIEQETKLEPKESRLHWSLEDSKKYNENQFDQTKWNTKMLNKEIAYVDNDPWPTQSPITKLPYPVATYGPGYEGYSSKGLTLEINDKIIKGGTFAVATNEHSIEPKHNPDKSNIIFFNILILTDKPKSENSSLSVSSRNYPHHTCQGRRKTSIGNIDWVAMHMATGDKFALINTKYFNLEYGQTILVAPQKDGSLRFKQVKLPTLATDEIDEQITMLGEKEDIVEFFMKPTHI